jgi:phosphomannomutase
VAFDGDGDRVAFVDGRGNWVDPEVVGTFLHRHLSPASRPLVASVDASGRCEQFAAAVRSRVGGRFVQTKMRQTGAVVGFEGSGHYYLSRWGPSSDGILVACVLADLLARAGVTLGSLADDFGPIFRANKAIEFVSRRTAARSYAAIRQALGGRALEPPLDGTEVRVGAGRVLFRLSNTQPAIRVMLEAVVRSGLEDLQRFLEEILQAASTREPSPPSDLKTSRKLSMGISARHEFGTHRQ